MLAKLRKRLSCLHRDMRGATALEWTLLLGAIALPSYVVIQLGVSLLVVHYTMLTTLNGMPMP